MEAPPPELLVFIHTHGFERSRKGILNDEELRQAERQIMEYPLGEGVEEGTGGVRKTRAATGGQGKSGGARIMYLWVPKGGVVYLLLAYPKNVKASLSDAEKKKVRELVKRLKGER